MVTKSLLKFEYYSPFQDDGKQYVFPSDMDGGKVGAAFRLAYRKVQEFNSGYITGIPIKYYQDKSGPQIRVLLIANEIAERRDVKSSDLGFPFTINGVRVNNMSDLGDINPGEAFRRAFGYASQKLDSEGNQFIGGIPNFEVNSDGMNGIVFLKKKSQGYVIMDWRDCTPSELGISANSNYYDTDPWTIISSLVGKKIELVRYGEKEEWHVALPNFESSGNKNGVYVFVPTPII